MRVLLSGIILLFTCITIAACSKSPDEKDSGKVLRFSVLPDEDPASLRARYEGLLEFISQRTGFQCELVLSKNYQDLLERFDRGEIDVARFGGFSFVQAQKKSGAVPLVMRDVDTRFVSYFLVPGASSAKSLHDLKGMRFSFGSRLSTSGHLMPRYFLQKSGIQPETFFSAVSYSGAHDRTAEWVMQGKIDVGVANSLVIDSLFKSSQLSVDHIRILSRTPPYADYVWAAQDELSEHTGAQLIDAFLALSTDKPATAAILRTLQAEYYVPATLEDFAGINRTARELNLLN